MKIVAGIDFGTSMTMIQTLDHEECGQETTECRPVRFTQSAQAATPTLIRLDRENGLEWFGEEAQNADKGTLHENFKLDLWSEDDEKREQARDLVERFFRYLYACYSEEKNKLYMGAQQATEETVVGHPVQWDAQQRSMILDAARKAGFQNVRGMDEASASVICVLTHNQHTLRQSGYMQKGKPLNIMVLDMGAGTTDLAFVSVNGTDDGLKIELQGTWPPRDYPEVFGGSQIDRVLAERLAGWLNDCGLPEALTQQFIRSSYLQLKTWKEYNVSSDLEENMTVSGCSALSMAQSMAQHMPGAVQAPFPSFGREEFEEMLSDEIGRFVRTIQSAPEELRNQTDLVFLTGGNSQWYWVPEILSGQNSRFGDVGLPKIRYAPEAIQKTTYPTETVSRGLVYMGKEIRFMDAPKAEEPMAEKPKEDEGSGADERSAQASVQEPEHSMSVSGAEPEMSRPAAQQSDEDIFVEWRARRERAAYPNMRMMNRLYIETDRSIGVTNGGRVLLASQVLLDDDRKKLPALRNIDAVYDSSHFRTKDGWIVSQSGEIVLPAGMTPVKRGFHAISDSAAIDPDGRVCLITGFRGKRFEELWKLIGGDEAMQVAGQVREGAEVDRVYPLSCWSEPMEQLQFAVFYQNNELKQLASDLGLLNARGQVNALIGLNRRGEITCRRAEMIQYLHQRYPALTLNPNGTLEKDVVEFFFTPLRGLLYMLTKDGELRCCKPSENTVLTRPNIAHIMPGQYDSVGFIDELGNLIKCYNGDITQIGKFLMNDCAAAYIFDNEVIAMNSSGRVRYVEISTLMKKIHQREAERWNLYGV